MTLATSYVRHPAPRPALRLGCRLPSPRLAVWTAPARPPTAAVRPGDLPARRHALVLLAGAAALPALAVLGLTHGRPLVAVLVALLGPAGLLAVAGLPALPARLRSVAAAAGLLAGCAVGVHLAPAVTETHFSFFLATLLLCLYRDGLLFVAALVVTGLGPYLPGTPGAVGPDVGVSGVVVLHLAAVVAAAAVSAVVWALADVDLSSRAPGAARPDGPARRA